MPILISGVGRSGTTALFRSIGEGLLQKYPLARCKYEPYLWNIPEVERTANVTGQPFRMGQVGQFNSYVHCHTPLFLSGRYELHDRWLNSVFGPVGANERLAPDNTMAKVIRGSGRLESALTRFDNLLVVVVTRNVVDTVNSSRSMFSFFGEEFHPSDRPRFIAEVNARNDAGIDPQKISSEVQWAALWWRHFTDAAIAVCEKYPDRTLLVSYEDYVERRLYWSRRIFDFCGLDRSVIDEDRISQIVGPSTSRAYLSLNEVTAMSDDYHWYFERLNEATGSEFNSVNTFDRLLFDYAGRPYGVSQLADEDIDMTPVQLRLQLRDQAERSEPPSLAPKTVSVARALSLFGSDRERLLNERSQQQKPVRSQKSVGVLVTTYNNQETVQEAVYSVLAQTRPPEVICVADDGSADATVERVRELQQLHKEVRLVARKGNVGVAANRDLALKSLQVDLLTTLDGDDVMMPAKLELEMQALEGSTAHVAFSDIAVIKPEDSFVQDTRAYSGASRERMLQMMLSRSVPVPRDVLFSRQLFEHAQGFDVGLSLYEDWSFKLRLVLVATGWRHSGAVGTVYNRLQQGLSARSELLHAYRQLQVLGRNSDALMTYPGALARGLKMIFQRTPASMRPAFKHFIDAVGSNDVFLGERLRNFWAESTFRDDAEAISEHFRQLYQL
ncbi:MAG: glycosyltransferase family 2 protein [Pseudomonadota bacterium]